MIRRNQLTDEERQYMLALVQVAWLRDESQLALEIMRKIEGTDTVLVAEKPYGR